MIQSRNPFQKQRIIADRIPNNHWAHVIQFHYISDIPANRLFALLVRFPKEPDTAEPAAPAGQLRFLWLVGLAIPLPVDLFNRSGLHDRHPYFRC
jgi:hypothetical protein